MKRLFLLIALLGVFSIGCEELLPDVLKPSEKPSDNFGEPPFFITNSEDNYNIDGTGGEVIVIVATDMEYSIIIPEEVQSWLSIADTRTKEHIDHCKFIVTENSSFDSRSAEVRFISNNGEVLLTINILQRPINCPANEIWYTNGSTTKPTYPSNVDAFGVNIISNTYNEKNNYWIIKFDGEVKTIGSSAFNDCSNLISITIPYSVTTIGDNAFFCCDSLTSVTIPDRVTEIGHYAFYGCISLTSVTIPDNVTTIGQWAFVGCSSLTSVTIPDSVTTIWAAAFGNCSNLKEFNGKYASEDGRCLIIGGTLISFAPAGLAEYTIPDRVTTIGPWAFASCSSPTSVTIPDSVTTIGPWAFENSSSLTSVTIGDSVTTIGEDAFDYCSSLTSVYITDLSAWCKIDFGDDSANPLNYAKNLYLNNELITDLVIPSDITEIKSYAFDSYSSLTSVTIPDSVTTIGNYAFSGCNSLINVTISDSVTTIGNYAFAYCESLTSVTIPDSVTTIGEGAFFYCDSLTSVTIGDSVTEIGHYAFYWCSSLTSVTIGDSVTTIGQWAFVGCSSLTSVTIPDSVTTIWAAAFSNCSNLKEFNGKYASEDGRCLIIDGTLISFAPAGLTEYIIPDRVTRIGYWAFCDCSSLTSVTIPDSVTTIGYEAFYGCSSLISVYCKAITPPTAYFDGYGDWDAFDDNASGRKIYVPTESVEAYKSAQCWSDYADAIVGYDF